MDLMIDYNNNPDALKQYEKYSVQVINPAMAVIYVPVSQVTSSLIYDYGYTAIPKCFSLTKDNSLEASGITRLRRIPALNLRGKGTIVGIVSTGIDYTNPVFKYPDGTTKILEIWDQTIDSVNQYPKVEFPSFYGTNYTAEQINMALKSPNPYQIVPSMDEIGDGTMLAGIAAGSDDNDNNFSGVVPDANLIVVKLKKAKKNLTDFFFIPNDVNCYQENDIIWAIQYMVDTARRFRRPLALCIGLGTSQESHDEYGSFLSRLILIAGDFPKVAISVSAGNEGNRRRHFYSKIDPAAGPILVELNVGENEPGFSLELWGDPPTIYTLDILTPSGEYIAPIVIRMKESRRISFIFDETIIYIDYDMIEQQTGKQMILLRFQRPTQGIWKFKVFGRGDLKGAFHIWLPTDNFISDNTYFLNPDPNTTVTSPGNSIVPITVTAYNSSNGSLYQYAGKGYSTSNDITPNLAAPGVNIKCPSLNHSFTTMTGTSAAAAHTTGITAMILEWSIVQNNYPDIDTVAIKNFLIRGAMRSVNLQYPNPDWGYGIIDIYGAYNIFKLGV